MPLRSGHQTLVTLAVLLGCLAFLGLTGSLTNVQGTGGCRITAPVIHNWGASWPLLLMTPQQTWHAGTAHQSTFVACMQCMHALASTETSASVAQKRLPFDAGDPAETD